MPVVPQAPHGDMARTLSHWVRKGAEWAEESASGCSRLFQNDYFCLNYKHPSCKSIIDLFNYVLAAITSMKVVKNWHIELFKRFFNPASSKLIFSRSSSAVLLQVIYVQISEDSLPGLIARFQLHRLVMLRLTFLTTFNRPRNKEILRYYNLNR